MRGMRGINGRRGLWRRGQAEIIGGLIILTVLFLLAIPLLLGAFSQAARTINQSVANIAEANVMANERLEIIPVDPENDIYRRLGWIPGVFIVNRGTVEVQLTKAYLIDITQNRIVYILDLTILRQDVAGTVNSIVSHIALNASPANPVGDPLPPRGEPIPLGPGDSLLLVFNLANPENYMIAVESARGVIHPVGGGGGASLAPRVSATPAGQGQAGADSVLRPIFAPLGGFKILGAQELQSKGNVTAWRPFYEIIIERTNPRGNDVIGQGIQYEVAFIYSDPDPEHKALSLVYIKVPINEYGVVRILNDVNVRGCSITPLSEVYIHGFVGTYYYFTEAGAGNVRTGGGGDGDNGEDSPFEEVFDVEEIALVYVRGYAVKIEVRYPTGQQCIIEAPQPYVQLNVFDSVRFDVDFDGNGINELTMFSYFNAPGFSNYNVDADSNIDVLTDSLLWQYIVARDISGSDYIRITGKINYYRTATYNLACPPSFEPLRIFSVAVYRFDEVTGSWVLEHWKDFYYSRESLRQFQFTAIFPVDRNSIYRVGVLFYDHYYDFLGDCFIDFTYTLEFLDVEFGIVHPFLEETPPIYIVAIPNPALISGIGEDSYAAWAGVSINEAKLIVQKELLEAIDSELNFVGIGNYVVIDSVTELCNVLFPNIVQGSTMEPPKDAIIIWLQGDVSISDVTSIPGSPCSVSERLLASYIGDYGWIFVQATGTPFWNVPQEILPLGAVVLRAGGDAEITPEGEAARAKYVGFAMLNVLPFNTLVEVTSIGSPLIVPSASFYAQPAASVYGHVAFQVAGLSKGAYLVMHIVPVWGDTGPTPITVAQLAVFGGLEAYAAIKGSGN